MTNVGKYLVIALAVVAIVYLQSPVMAGVWSLQTVDGTTNIGMYNSMALDSSNNEHISYQDVNSSTLKYTHRTGSGWACETVDSTRGTGYSTSIALDGAGRAHISYINWSGSTTVAKYAYWNGSSWVKETVDSIGSSGLGTSIALDSTDKPRFCYYDGNTSSIKYAYWNGSSWVKQAVDSIAAGNDSLALVVDASDVPHIAYVDPANYQVKYAYWGGSSWVKQTIGTYSGSGRVSLAVDSLGHPHIAYSSTSAGNLKYTTYNGSIWTTATVTSGSAVYYPAIALDSSGKPSISYRANYGDLNLAYLSGSTWIVKAAVRYDYPAHISMKMDSTGKSRISYYSQTYADLGVAVWNGTSWQFERPDGTGGVGTSACLVLDASGRPAITYKDNANEDLRYACWTGSSWDIQTIDSEGDVGQDSSLAFDSTGKPHVFYYDWDRYTPRYAYWNGSAWIKQDFDAPTLSADNPCLVFDRLGKAHVVYDAGDGALIYATRNGTSWDKQTVQFENDALAGYPSLAFDSLNRPHISYRYVVGSTDLLNYAYWNGTGWTVQTLHTTTSFIQDNSITLDAADRPRIAYACGEHGIEYTHWTGTGWANELVDRSGWIGSDRALKLDSGGRPHIAYYDSSSLNLKYAYWDGQSWVKQAVDGSYNVGNATSLVIDSTGSAHIAYTACSSWDLKYAKMTTPPPAVTDDGQFTDGTTALHATWPAQSGIVEYMYAIGRSPYDLITSWKSTGSAAKADATGLSLEAGQTYYCYVRGRDSANAWTAIGNSNGITAARACTLGEARKSTDGQPVVFDAVTLTYSPDAVGVWVAPGRGLAGMSVSPEPEVGRSTKVKLAGIPSWINGVPTLQNAELKSTSGTSVIKPVGFANRALANDRMESLNYAGINPVGMLVSVWGKVTYSDDSYRVFYIDDGSNLADGMGPASAPYTGLRIEQPAPFDTIPAKGLMARVTGVRGVKKVVLSQNAVVNGVQRLAGQTIYVPVVYATSISSSPVP